MEAKELRSIVMFKPVCLAFWALTFASSSSASASSFKGSGSLVLVIPLAVTSSQNAIRGVNAGEDDNLKNDIVSDAEPATTLGIVLKKSAFKVATLDDPKFIK
jgi:hypothetical protein